MKICIMGSGGLGGFFGGWLAAAGAEVSFIARGKHLAAIRSNGLTITSQLGDRYVGDVRATDDTSEIGPVDIILFCVKNYDLEQAAKQCLPLLHANTAVISLLNGVDAAESLESILGSNHAVPGVTYIPSNIARPGVIAHLGDKSEIVFGEQDDTISTRLTEFRDICRDAGLDAQVTTDIATKIWTKFVGWSAASSVTSASRQPFGGIQSQPVLVRLFRDVASETYKVGRSKGIALPDNLVEQLVTIVRSFPPEAKSSMLVDLELGKRLELETACGRVVKLGEKLDVETPLTRALYALLMPYADG